MTPANKAVTLQLGNVGLLIGAVGATIVFRSNAPTLRAYLTFQVMADISHVVIMFSVMGRETFSDVSKWNFMTWANIVGALSICGLRVATLAGVFGTIEPKIVKSE